MAAAEVQAEDVEGNPGYPRAPFFLPPHCPLDTLTVSLRLAAEWPPAKP